MPNNESPTKGLTSNGEKKILKQTIGKTLKPLFVLIIVIAILLMLLVSFLKIIWKADTADQMMDKKHIEEIEKENE